MGILLVRSRSHAWGSEMLAATSNVRVCYSKRQADHSTARRQDFHADCPYRVLASREAEDVPLPRLLSMPLSTLPYLHTLS